MDTLRSYTRAAEIDSALLAGIIEHAHERLPEPEAVQLSAFMRQYYRRVPVEDLAGRSALNLYGAALAHWRLAQSRTPGTAAIRVYNPHVEHDGWQCSHTAIDIVSGDMPFVVDSVTMALGRAGAGIHLIIHPVMRLRRDDAGVLLEVLPPDGPVDAAATRESVLHAEVDHESDPEQLEALRASIASVLEQVRAAVDDWEPMRERLRSVADELEHGPNHLDADERRESAAFLRWLDDNHFTFLGYEELEVVRGRRGSVLAPLAGTAVGVPRLDAAVEHSDADAAWTATMVALPEPVVLTKASTRATVHRPSYLDHVGVKHFDERGRLVGEHRFLGLYTTLGYWERAQQIPILRGKVAYVLERAGFAPDSHDRKALLEILEEYPRDELVQIAPDELFATAMGILAIAERQRVRLFVRRDAFRRFTSCLVFLPRDRFNTLNRQRIAAVLGERLHATLDDWTLLITEESVLVRIHYLFRTDPAAGEVPVDTGEIEARLVEVTRAWTEDLRDALVDEYGEEPGLDRYVAYADAFPAGYREDWVARAAVADIHRIEETAEHGGLWMVPYRSLEAPEGLLRCKLFSSQEPIVLSDVLPMFENMGLRITDERPYELTPKGRGPLWLYDFGFLTERAPAFEATGVAGRFQEAFVGVWRGTYENDALNRLVLDAQLSGREVALLRAIGRYLRQAAPALGDVATSRALTAHPEIAATLVALFGARLDPAAANAAAAARLQELAVHGIDAVASLDEDRVLRGYLAVVQAMTRTDYFQHTADGGPKPSLAFKLDSQLLALLPEPRPRFEIFVHSPRVEGVHLRGGAVARGGLRWSDRREDFRTEILGLMKAQTVKNAVIVPVGAKGGFVVKQPPADGGHGALRDEVIACYRTFVSSLLELTDNFVDGELVPPTDVVRLDGDDPYLVVAADKGTATLSDLANEISAAHGFWLGDAFASGGSTGYDHKRLGITARGAWEAVKRHFRELGTDVQSTDFTVVGIGDMSGDVFGNGMLRSSHIRLVGAFNHMHVFMDPDPDAETSFAERERLFALEGSGWSDYDAQLISRGGGVYERSAKAIPLSPQARLLLGVDAEQLAPDEVIRALLRAPVDLLFNGGIGTYVKAAAETHADVGDKANDAVRVDAAQLRCRVVCEGGNLGVTQRGRVEFAIAGGRINTDAIDNVGGVNCSDREVNIKILLDAVVAAGDLTVKQRNALLAEASDEVTALVLRDSYTQSQALGLAVHHAPALLDVHARLMRSLELSGELDRALEFLPTDEEIAERRLHDRGLTSPELAVLLAHTKIGLHSALTNSTLPDDEDLADELVSYFPAPLPKRFADELHHHRLRREIIATHLVNDYVDHAGISAAFALGEETGAPPADLVSAYVIAREVFGMREFWAAVEGLDNRADAQTQTAMLLEGRKLLERAARWLVRNCRSPLSVGTTIARYVDGATALRDALPNALEPAERESSAALAERLAQGGAPAALASRAAAMGTLPAALDVVEIGAGTGAALEIVIAAYFRTGSHFSLQWLRDRILELPRSSRWQVLARAALRDDVSVLQRELTTEIVSVGGGEIDAAIEAWTQANATAVERYMSMLADIKASRTYDLTTLPVALREGRNLLPRG